MHHHLNHAIPLQPSQVRSQYSLLSKLSAVVKLGLEVSQAVVGEERDSRPWCRGCQVHLLVRQLHRFLVANVQWDGYKLSMRCVQARGTAQPGWWTRRLNGGLPKPNLFRTRLIKAMLLVSLFYGRFGGCSASKCSSWTRCLGRACSVDWGSCMFGGR